VPPTHIKHTLALACNILAMEGHLDLTLGHVSARADDRTFYLKQSGFGLDEITPDRIVLLGYDGDRLDGEGGVHREFPLHAEILRARPDVGSVVHTHPPYVIALDATGTPIRPVSHDGILFASDAPVFTKTSDLIDKPELGQQVVHTLGDAPAMILRYHGMVAVGAGIEEACTRAIFLERAARIQLLAASGGSYSWTPDNELEGKLRNVFDPALMRSYWEYWVRKLQRSR
jgi:ribulose-5-phosphate 4-epimerase/fuculose-1-phosphate aldolase